MIKAKVKSRKAKIKMKKVRTPKTEFSLFTFHFLLFLLCVPVVNHPAQTGGAYRIEKTVVASGGVASAGGGYSLVSTAGQSIAGGFLQGSGVSEYSGFWVPVLAPTVASVSIGGRVLTAGGQGIRNARVMLTAPDGTIRFSLTGSFGFYRFNDVTVGATYILTVSSRGFVFTDPTRVVSVNDELVNLDFVAE